MTDKNKKIKFNLKNKDNFSFGLDFFSFLSQKQVVKKTIKTQKNIIFDKKEVVKAKSRSIIKPSTRIDF